MAVRAMVLGAGSAALVSFAAAEEPGWRQLPEITLQLSDLPGMCATVRADGIAENRACAGTPDQRFRAPGPDGGVLRYGDLCMAAPDEGNYPELRAVPCGSGGDHYWIVDHEGRLANNVGRCLALMGGASREGGMIFGSRCDDTGQTWRFMPADDVWQPRTEAEIHIGANCLAWQEGGNYLKAAPCASEPHAAFSFAVNRPTQIRARSACVQANIDGSPLSLGDCHDMPSQLWTLSGGHLMNGAGRCALPDADGVLRSQPCPDGPGDVRFPDLP